MSKFEFELDTAGVGQLLKSPEMMRVCKRYAQGIASHANSKGGLSEQVGRSRVNVSVSGDPDKLLKGIK